MSATDPRFARPSQRLRNRSAWKSSSACRRNCAAATKLRRHAAVLVDELLAAGTPIGPESLEPLLLRPPWSSTRCKPCSHNVARSRAALIERQPRAVALLRYVDATTLARAPYRRLTQRHSPWAEASARATIAAVQRARLRQAAAVLVAEGGLGVEAAVAVAAGAIVVCEPNPHCARAVAAVAEAHGIGPRVTVVQRTLEHHLRDNVGAAIRCDRPRAAPRVRRARAPPAARRDGGGRGGVDGGRGGGAFFGRLWAPSRRSAPAASKASMCAQRTSRGGARTRRCSAHAGGGRDAGSPYALCTSTCNRPMPTPCTPLTCVSSAQRRRRRATRWCSSGS